MIIVISKVLVEIVQKCSCFPCQIIVVNKNIRVAVLSHNFVKLLSILTSEKKERMCWSGCIF